MQIKDESSQNPYAQTHAEHEYTDESELPTAVKTGSLIALIAVVLGTLIGSLLASPDPSEIADQDESEVITSTELTSEPETTTFESSTTPVTPPVTTSNDTTSAVTSTPPTVTTIDPVTSTDTTVTSTPEIETTTDPVEAGTTAPVTTTSPTTEIETSTPTTTPATPATPPDTTTGSSLPEIEPTTPETTTSVDPSPLATTPEIAAATPPDAATLEQLNQTVYQTIDQAWTTTPVTAESVYLVKVDQNGSITGFEPKSQVATDNADNTPLPGLASSETTAAASFAEFNVIFRPDGSLEVNQAN